MSRYTVEFSKGNRRFETTEYRTTVEAESASAALAQVIVAAIAAAEGGR
jgi:hypothetical protein